MLHICVDKYIIYLYWHLIYDIYFRVTIILLCDHFLLLLIIITFCYRFNSFRPKIHKYICRKSNYYVALTTLRTILKKYVSNIIDELHHVAYNCCLFYKGEYVAQNQALLLCCFVSQCRSYAKLKLQDFSRCPAAGGVSPYYRFHLNQHIITCVSSPTHRHPKRISNESCG